MTAAEDFSIAGLQREPLPPSFSLKATASDAPFEWIRLLVGNHAKFMLTWNSVWRYLPSDGSARRSVADIGFAYVALFNSGFPSATDEVENEHHQGDDEKDMDEPTCEVKRESAAPKQQKENGNDE